MNRKRHSAVLLLFVVLLLLSAGVLARRFITTTELGVYKVFANRVKYSLLKRLVFEHPLPPHDNRHSANSPVIVYILGGGQESLRHRFKTAGRLYKEGTVKKFLVRHNPGITEYSHKLGRNLTNDEWLVLGLEREGVAAKDVGFTSLPPTLFGTFGEARAVSALARSGEAKQLVLITSIYHTERVRLSFSHFNADNVFNVNIYGSEENVGIYELLKEDLKLQLYRCLVIPTDRWFKYSSIPGIRSNACEGRLFRNGRFIQTYPDRNAFQSIPRTWIL